MDIAILRLTDELIRSSGLDAASKKVLYANIGRYIAVEETERGYLFFPETLAGTEKGTQAKWDKLNDTQAGN